MKQFTCALLLALLAGCASDTTTTTGTTTTATPNPAITTAIQSGTSLALSIGLPLLPNQPVVQADSKLALQAVNDVLATLKGSASGVASALQTILSLSAFDKVPEIQNALKLVLPLLTANLPSSVTSGIVTTVPADVLAYLTAFFTGAQQGLTNYLPTAIPKAVARDVVPAQITAGAATLNVADLKTKFAAIQVPAAK